MYEFSSYLRHCSAHQCPQVIFIQEAWVLKIFVQSVPEHLHIFISLFPYVCARWIEQFSKLVYFCNPRWFPRAVGFSLGIHDQVKWFLPFSPSPSLLCLQKCLITSSFSPATSSWGLRSFFLFGNIKSRRLLWHHVVGDFGPHGQWHTIICRHVCLLESAATLSWTRSPLPIITFWWGWLPLSTTLTLSTIEGPRILVIFYNIDSHYIL